MGILTEAPEWKTPEPYWSCCIVPDVVERIHELQGACAEAQWILDRNQHAIRQFAGRQRAPAK